MILIARITTSVNCLMNFVFVVGPEKCGELKRTLESGTMKVSVPICGKPKPSVTWTVQDETDPVVESPKNDLPWNFTYTASFQLLACQNKNVSYIADGYGSAIEGKTFVKADCKLICFVISYFKLIMMCILYVKFTYY